MIRVTALAPYPTSGPSTRFRLAQFQAPLLSRGIELRIAPFMDEVSFRALYGQRLGTRLQILARGLGDRIRTLETRTDAWLVHREVAPMLSVPLLAELVRRGVPYAYDFDDAVYLPAPGGHPLVQRLRRPVSTTAALVREAAVVLAGNEVLAGFARTCRRPGGVQGVRVLPTVIDTDRFRPKAERAEAHTAPLVGWIGTHTTVPYLSEVLPALATLRERLPFRFRVISNQRPPWDRWGGLEIEYTPWSADDEVGQTQELDLGLYPLHDTPWERGKCGFKALQYLACGVPVVASEVGVIPDILGGGENGLLVAPGGDWSEPLERLLGDPRTRRTMGARGRTTVEEGYSVRSAVAGMEAALRITANRSLS